MPPSHSNPPLTFIPPPHTHTHTHTSSPHTIPSPYSLRTNQQVHRYYRVSGASLNKATSEAVAGVAHNKYVRETVKEGVKAGVSGALSGDK